MIPDGNHPGFPNCYYFFGGALGNEDSKSGPNQYFSKDGDKLDGCDFDLKLYPVFSSMLMLLSMRYQVRSPRINSLQQFLPKQTHNATLNILQAITMVLVLVLK